MHNWTLFACSLDFLDNLNVAVDDILRCFFKFSISLNLSYHAKLSSNLLRLSQISIDDPSHDFFAVSDVDIARVDKLNERRKFSVAEDLLNNFLKVKVLFNAVAVDVLINPK